MTTGGERVVRFGVGALGQLGEVLGELGAKRALLVCSPRSAPVAASLPVAEAFAGVRAHVPQETVLEAAARASAADADALVGLGGGAAIDTCKAVVAHLA
ncbi:MAG: iron-containing alcohol dehydrogenase, partial [Gaiella sp.]